MCRIGSSEFNADEVSAIGQSMDRSIAFWGRPIGPPDKIPASRLKCGLRGTEKAASAALKIWGKMEQRDLEKMKEIEVTLMREGEIDTMELLNGLESITEGIGLEFKDMLKSVDDDVLEATIALTNQILHIFNENVPPEIFEEDVCGSFLHCYPTVPERLERQKMSSKIKNLLNKARRLGLKDVTVPSSPYLTERTKLSLMERHLKAKMKVINVQRALGRKESVNPDSLKKSKYGQSIGTKKQRMFAQQKRESNLSSLVDRPKFKTTFKAQSLRYENLITHTPALSTRIKRVPELRKTLMDKNKTM